MSSTLDMVTMRDIARMAHDRGLVNSAGAYGTIRQWRVRGLLPEPAGVVAQSPWWLRTTIEAWLDTRVAR